MFNYESFRFWLKIVVGNLGVFTLPKYYSKGFGATRNKKQRGDAIFVAFVAMVGVFMFGVIPRLMDIPAILSLNHGEMEGTVYAYDAHLADNWVGGELKLKDNASGKIYRFIDTDISPELMSEGDLVKIKYLRHTKVAEIIEINGKKLTYWFENNNPMAIIIVVGLFLSMPLYYLQIFKLKPYFSIKETCSIYVYQEKLVYSMLAVYFFLLQTAAVLIISMLGYYKVSWDWYWGSLLLIDYAGMGWLGYIRQKRFAVVKDKFYYCAYKKRCEGEKLEELTEIKKSDKGIVICTKDREMEIYCKQGKYLDTFLKKLPVKKEMKNLSLEEVEIREEQEQEKKIKETETIRKTGTIRKNRIISAVFLVILTGVIVLLNPFSTEKEILDIVSGQNESIPLSTRYITGVAGVVISAVFIQCYYYLVFRLKLYRRKANRYVAYIYHDIFFAVVMVVWNVWMFGALFFAGATFGEYKTSWNWIFNLLLIIGYIGCICLEILRQQVFVIEDDTYIYHDFKKSFSGKLKDIQSAEKVQKGFVLYANGRRMHIRCCQKPYEDLLCDKLSKYVTVEK